MMRRGPANDAARSADDRWHPGPHGVIVRPEMADSRCVRGCRRVPGGDSPGLFAVAQLLYTAHSGSRVRVHFAELRKSVLEPRNCAIACQFAAVFGGHGAVLALSRHGARVDERAHQYAIQTTLLRPRPRAAHRAGNIVYGLVDHAWQPEDRHPEPVAAALVRDRGRVFQRLLALGDDLGGRSALLAHGLFVDDRGVSLDGSCTRRIGSDERGGPVSGTAPHHPGIVVARNLRDPVDTLRTRNRVLRSPGAARNAGWNLCVHVRDLRGDPSLSEPDRARLCLRGDAARDDIDRNLLPVPT